MMANKEYVVIDTNVLHVADLTGSREEIEAEYGNLSDVEILNCIRVLRGTKESNGAKILVLDCGGKILEEYSKKKQRNYTQISGKFLKWCKDCQYDSNSIDRVEITEYESGGKISYKEFPNQPGLQKFDEDDKKFIAVANAHPKNPIIFTATDAEWWKMKDKFKEAKIRVKFLCENYVKEKSQKQ